MNSIAKSLIFAFVAATAGSSFAQDAMKKSGPMAADAMAKKEVTMQDCKDHMAMAKKDGMKKDDAAMKMDATCSDMMKKDDAMKDQPMKK